MLHYHLTPQHRIRPHSHTSAITSSTLSDAFATVTDGAGMRKLGKSYDYKEVPILVRLLLINHLDYYRYIVQVQDVWNCSLPACYNATPYISYATSDVRLKMGAFSFTWEQWGTSRELSGVLKRWWCFWVDETASYGLETHSWYSQRNKTFYSSFYCDRKKVFYLSSFTITLNSEKYNPQRVGQQHHQLETRCVAPQRKASSPGSLHYWWTLPFWVS